MKKIILFFFISVLCLKLSSQINKYSVDLIPDSLKENADVIIRHSDTKIIINSIGDAEYSVKEVRTIMKKPGQEHGSLLVHYDNHTKIEMLEGIVYDTKGNIYKKIDKKDIKDYSNFEGSLYSDNRVKYIERPPLATPYTVEFHYKIKIDGLYGIPKWMPVSGFNVSVEEAIFTIESPKDLNFVTKEIYCNNLINKEIEDNVSKYILKGFRALEFESYNSVYENYFPVILTRLPTFKQSEYIGKSDTWEDMGIWMNKLLEGRLGLPDETIQEVKELIKDKNDTMNMVKAIYEFMQSKTRYVSIQVGIGGLQPFPAIIVDKNGYGDCKALTNYTKALLNVVGIKSHYAVVYAGNDYPPLIRTFPSHQSNHAILCVPINNDTIWLECTNNTAPFGYIGKFTDDRDVLIINSLGKGEIAHTTVYPKAVNKQLRTGEIDIDEKGKLTGNVITTYSGTQYENINWVVLYSEEEKEKKLLEMLSIPNLNLLNINYEENKDIIPSIKETIKFETDKYTTQSGNRMFLIPNILNKSSKVTKEIKNRKTDIILRRGFIDKDSIVYTISDQFILEHIPESVSEINEFGGYSASFSFKNSKLVYIRNYYLNKGIYPPEKFEELRDFFKLIYNSDKQTVVFVKR